MPLEIQEMKLENCWNLSKHSHDSCRAFRVRSLLSVPVVAVLWISRCGKSSSLLLLRLRLGFCDEEEEGVSVNWKRSWFLARSLFHHSWNS